MKRKAAGNIIRYSIVTFSLLCLFSDVLTYGLEQSLYVRWYYNFTQFFSPSILLGLFCALITYFHKLCLYNWVASFHITLIGVYNLASIHLLSESTGELYDFIYCRIVSVIIITYLIGALLVELKNKTKTYDE